MPSPSLENQVAPPNPGAAPESGTAEPLPTRDPDDSTPPDDRAAVAVVPEARDGGEPVMQVHSAAELPPVPEFAREEPIGLSDSVPPAEPAPVEVPDSPPGHSWTVVEPEAAVHESVPGPPPAWQPAPVPSTLEDERLARADAPWTPYRDDPAPAPADGEEGLLAEPGAPTYPVRDEEDWLQPGVPVEPRLDDGTGEAVEPEDGEVEEEAAPRPGGPNWMLAFVCAWAGATSFFEAWAYLVRSKSHDLAFIGYALLGAGLLFFAFEALQWGKRRTGLVPLLTVVIPTLLTLGGVVCLILSNDPGRRI